MLPFLGPSDVRDLSGSGVDFFDNPVTVNMSLATDIVLRGANGFNERAALLPMEGIVQGDKYLFVRDLYLQHRQFELDGGRVENDPFLDDSDNGDSSATVATAADNSSEPSAAAAASGAPVSAAPPPDTAAAPATTPAAAPAPATLPASDKTAAPASTANSGSATP